jgi:hypothetical protein
LAGNLFRITETKARLKNDGVQPRREHVDDERHVHIAGSVVGGLSEPLSMLLGFRHLLLLAMIYYLLSVWSPSFGGRAIGTLR